MEQISTIPDTLPILPSRSMLVYPTAIAMMNVEHESTFRLLDDIKDSHRLLVVAAQKASEGEPVRLTDMFRVGTVARLVQMRQIAEGKREIAVLGLERVVIGDLVQEQPYFLAHIASKADLEVQQDVSTDEIHETISSFRELIARSQKMPIQEVAPHIERKPLREVVYTMAFFAGVDLEHGQQLLEFDSARARLARLNEYLTTELERFNQEWQDAYEHLQRQGQATDKFEIALDALNTATTLKETSRVLTRQKSLLLKIEALDALRARIAQKHQQKASSRWSFLLEHDLELLEDANKHGLGTAKQHLDARIEMLQHQQTVFEAMKVLAMLDINDPQTLMHIMEKQEKEPFAPETFRVLYALTMQMENLEHRKQLQTLLHFLEDAQKDGKEKALIHHMKALRPDFENEIDHTIDVLKLYLTSATDEDAYLTLKQNQEILLSDVAHRLMEQQIAERYRVGDHRNANMLEVHLSLFEDARERGLDAAWQIFLEDRE